MATKKKAPAKKKAPSKKGRKISETPAPATKAKFPYTTKPGSLRKLLQLIPNRPIPPKFDKTLMQSWGFKDNNDMTILRVLKEVNLLSDRSEPTDIYAQYMHIENGAKALAPEIKRVYEPLFQASHKPYSDTNEQLKSYFNIYSGGSERSLEYQIQTFKALCENANFNDINSLGQIPDNHIHDINSNKFHQKAGTNNPHVNINVHIHLPENKSSRDYERIIEDIGRYIFGRSDGEVSEL